MFLNVFFSLKLNIYLFSFMYRVQKVITSPAHGPPIQLVSAQKIPHIQTITPLPRVNALNTVCLTLSTHGKGNYFFLLADVKVETNILSYSVTY